MAMAGNPELAAAVSNAGALGVLGSNSGWVPEEGREDHFRDGIRRIREMTDKPFGVNIPIYAMKELATKLVDIALEEKVKVVVCSGGSPLLFTRRIKEAGATSVHLVYNVKQAKNAEAAGVDIVIAEGYEAGGVNSPDELTTFVLVPCIADCVKIPVVAAGGICDARGFVAALALGAEGIQMGSRFVATEECRVHDDYKKAIVSAGETDTMITRRILGLRVRSLKNDFINRLGEMDQRGGVEEMKSFVGPGRAREGQILGDSKNGDMSIGQVAGMISEILTAREVIERVVNGTDAVMSRCLKARAALLCPEGKGGSNS
jgi:enoyl-[acyl-carrier protein] reductase II